MSDTFEHEARTLIDKWRDEWHLEPEPEMDGSNSKVYESLVDHVATALRIPRSPASAAPVADHLCLLCGHASIDVDGTCLMNVPICCDDAHGWRRCGCKCKFRDTAAATAAPQQLSDPRPSCWHCGVVLAYAPKLRCEDCPDECDVEGCDELGCSTTAAPVDHPAIPLLGYERVITIEWEKHNARRHELIEAGRTRLLSEDEMVELRELQWLAGIKRELLTGPSAAATVEQSDE